MHVDIRNIGTGRIINFRTDSNGRGIYTIRLDNPTVTPDGLYVARRDEFEFRSSKAWRPQDECCGS